MPKAPTPLEIFKIIFRSVIRQRVTFSSISNLFYHLLPVAGVIAAGWSVFEMLLMFWFECLIFCIYSAKKLKYIDEQKSVVGLFFGYSVFLIVNLAFIFVFGKSSEEIGNKNLFLEMFFFLKIILPFIAAVGFAFFSMRMEFKKFIIEKQYFEAKWNNIATNPMKKIALLHITLILIMGPSLIFSGYPFTVEIIAVIIFSAVKYIYEILIQDKVALDEFTKFDS